MSSKTTKMARGFHQQSSAISAGMKKGKFSVQRSQMGSEKHEENHVHVHHWSKNIGQYWKHIYCK
jgi:hypothetical protein